MEILSLLIESKIRVSRVFKFHWRCKKLLLSQLSFADDLLLFCYGDLNSVSILNSALIQFQDFSGLQANHSKSNIYMCGIQDDVKDQIKSLLGFPEGQLPVTYLGIPLISSRLRNFHCNELLVRIEKRVGSWINRNLSYAGRLLLIQFVISSIQTYWTSHLFLPQQIIDKIEQMMRKFLWSGTILGSNAAKVAWDKVCKPKKEGGLGIKHIKEWNFCLMLRYI